MPDEKSLDGYILKVQIMKNVKTVKCLNCEVNALACINIVVWIALWINENTLEQATQAFTTFSFQHVYIDPDWEEKLHQFSRLGRL